MKKKALLLTAPLILMGLAGCNKQAEEPTLSNISALSTTSKFYVGEQITSDSVIVQGEYSNGYSKKITSGYTVNPTLPYTFSEGDVGTKQFTITYNDKTTTFNVTVEKQGSEPILTGISAMSKVSKFTVGEQLTLDSIVVQETYSNGYSKTVTEGYTVTPSLPYTFNDPDIGTKTFAVAYKGMNTTFKVNVEDIPAGLINVTLVDQIPGGTPVTKTVSVAPKTCLPYPESQHIDDHVLAGWYTDKECTNEFDFDLPVVSDIQLYSKWVDASLDGLTFIPDDKDNPSCYTVAVDSATANKLPKNVVIPSKYKNKPVVNIYATVPYANDESEIKGFFGATIETISIPSSIVKIPDFAFTSCTYLKHVSLPDNLKQIGADAFAGTKSLKNIYLPEGLSDIGQECFVQSGLVDIKLPSTISSLGDAIFGVSLSLEKVDMSLCKYITQISPNCFAECMCLREVKLPSESLTMINSAAFGDCVNLRTIAIPDSVTLISYRAFTNCSSLKKVYFGDDSRLERIGAEAFKDCLNLKGFSIPKYVTTIEKNAFVSSYQSSVDFKFLNVDDLFTVSYGGKTYVDYKPNDLKEGYPTPSQLLAQSNTSVSRNAKSDTVSGYKYISCVDGCQIIGRVDESETITEYTIPLKITEGNTDLNVVGIASSAFMYKLIDKVTFETDNTDVNNNLKFINSGAFYACTSLNQIVNLNKCVNLETIEAAAFFNCGKASVSENKISLDFSHTKLKNIGEGAFYSFDALKEITLPSTLIHIGNRAFYQCVNLEKADFTLCSDLQTLGSLITLYANSSSNEAAYGYVFYGCQKLEEVDLSNTKITSILMYTFGNCTNLNSMYSNTKTKTGLKRVKLPNTVITIGDYAFAADYLLESINIPQYVYSLGTQSFASCLNLREIIIESSIGAQALYQTNATHDLFSYARDIYVPNGTEMSKKFKAEFTKGDSTKEGYDVWTDHEKSEYVALKPRSYSDEETYYISKMITVNKETEYTFRVMLDGTHGFSYLQLCADYSWNLISNVVDKETIVGKYYASEGADPITYDKDKLYDTSDYYIGFADDKQQLVTFTTGYLDITFKVKNDCDLYCIGFLPL